MASEKTDVPGIENVLPQNIAAVEDSVQPARLDDARLRVLQVITHLDMGGAESIAMSLIDGLRSRIDFSLFAILQHAEPGAVGRDMAARLDQWIVPVNFGVTGRFKSGGAVVAAYRLAREIRRFRPDVVHLHAEIAELTFSIAVFLSRAARIAPVLRTVHNSTLWIDWNRLGNGVTTVLATADAVAVSRNAADADAAIVTLRKRPRCDVIYNGVPRPKPDSSRAGVQANGPFRVLFAGRLVHQKGADLLPAILAEAYRLTERRDVCVTIAGSGVLQEAVEQGLADQLDGWNVSIEPPISGLANHLNDYDAVLLPSRYEGFALLPLEVLMAGVPLVTTMAPGLDEALPPSYPLASPVDNVTALGERLASVINGDEDYRAMAARCGDELAQRFSPAAMAQAYAERYRRLAARVRAR
ncbi:MAG: glycosyltransferase family 4 protein [Sphingomonas sp.]|nr:glycosyltransferase family 4 protein [Sphingomonas sp.]